MKCPACESTEIKRSKRKGFFEQSVLAVLWMYPFRCRMCGERFFRVRQRGAHRGQQRLPSDGIQGWLAAILVTLVLVILIFLVIVYLFSYVPNPSPSLT